MWGNWWIKATRKQLDKILMVKQKSSLQHSSSYIKVGLINRLSIKLIFEFQCYVLITQRSIGKPPLLQCVISSSKSPLSKIIDPRYMNLSLLEIFCVSNLTFMSNSRITSLYFQFTYYVVLLNLNPLTSKVQVCPHSSNLPNNKIYPVRSI